jgi:hypothetical protein
MMEMCTLKVHIGNLLVLQFFFLFEPVPLIYMIKKMLRFVDLIIQVILNS